MCNKINVFTTLCNKCNKIDHEFWYEYGKGFVSMVAGNAVKLLMRRGIMTWDHLWFYGIWNFKEFAFINNFYSFCDVKISIKLVVLNKNFDLNLNECSNLSLENNHFLKYTSLSIAILWCYAL